MIDVELARRLRLTVVTHADLAAPRSIPHVVECALRGGATAVQLRNKGDNARDLVALGHRLRGITRRYGALLLVNDRFDIAMVVDADGVHLGPGDLPVEVVRGTVPARFVIGRSADDVLTAAAAVRDGADYIGCGAVFGTSTKDVEGEAIGPDRLDRVARGVDVPVVGIGGITTANVGSLVASAASGVAVVGALMTARDPEAVARALVAGFLERDATPGKD